MLSVFPSSKYSLFHNSNVFGSCTIHILYTGCAKIKKKNNSGTKRFKMCFKEKKPERRFVPLWMVQAQHIPAETDDSAAEFGLINCNAFYFVL